MSTLIRCDCGKTLRAPAELAGKKVRCVQCGIVHRVPAPSSAVEEGLREGRGKVAQARGAQDSIQVADPDAGREGAAARRVSRRRRAAVVKADQGRVALVIASAALVGFVLFVVAGGVAWWALARPQAPRQAQVAAPPVVPPVDREPPWVKGQPEENPLVKPLVRPDIVAGPAIPQDPERQKKRQLDRLAWHRKTLVEAYDKVGKKDPRWDKSAREALEEAARALGRASDPPGRWDAVHSSAARAVAADCDDPMILYLHYASSIGANDPGPEVHARRALAAAEAMRPSKYPPLRQASALLAAGQRRMARGGSAAEVRRLVDEALGEIARSTEDQDPEAEDLRYDLSKVALVGYLRLGDAPDEALRRMDGALGKAEALLPTRRQLEATILIDSAWQARGSGVADTVTEEGWATFRRDLAAAREVLEQAWQARPNDARTATLVLLVEKGIGGDRAAMEKWFERAMRADGDNLWACQIKLDWLDPKWHGSAGEMLGFGRACRETKNWRAGITLLAADAHRRASLLVVPRERQPEYFLSPEVQAEVKEVYEEYLKHNPDDHRQRSFYAAYRTLSGHWAEADSLFRAVGDRLAWDPATIPEKWMKQLRDHAARKAKEMQK